jgi:uncharacterized protein YecE (DUF72 family)
MIRVGTAGWSIPRLAAAAFPGSGFHLERYSRVLGCTEINSSFHRPHAHSVYARWASLTPREFRFSVKVPRTITHEGALKRARAPLEQFLGEIAGLRSKLGPLLLQLPPSLAFNVRIARSFFDLLREQHAGPVVCEPRHATWFEPAAAKTLIAYRIGLVAADPSRITDAIRPGGWMGRHGDGAGAVVYYRLHGSPRMYWSRYSIERIERWAESLRALPPSADVWCIFDNTASGSAIENALELVGCLPVEASKETKSRRSSQIIRVIRD